jgi:hypothetical protein
MIELKEPVKPVEPITKLIIKREVEIFYSSEFNKLNKLEEQLKLIETSKSKYKLETEEYTTAKIIDFKLELSDYHDYKYFVLIALEEEDDYLFNKRKERYKYELVDYEIKLEAYKKQKRELYLQLKEEFNEL